MNLFNLPLSIASKLKDFGVNTAKDISQGIKKFPIKTMVGGITNLAKTTVDAIGAPYEVISYPVESGAKKIFGEESIIPALLGFGATLMTPGGEEKMLSKTENITRINKYLKNAYRVFTGQKPYQIVAQITEDVAKRTDLPRDIVVNTAFFEKMARSHPEIGKDKLFSFVKTLNIPDEIYKIPSQDRLNFFRALENEFMNVVGTLKKGEGPTAQQVVTSIITSKKYPQNIKKTAEAVFLRFTGGTVAPSSVMVSPSAGQIISDVSNPLVSQVIKKK